MAKPLAELRERLLRAGIAPRHVRRYLTELQEHLSDLISDEVRSGRNRQEAETTALSRLGSVDELAERMIAKPQFRSIAARAPWAVLGLGPVVGLAVVWVLSLTILITGWKLFLPQAETPFVRVSGFAEVYFGLGRMLYFAAPVLVGWAVGVIAARQRLRATWLLVGWPILAWCGGMAQVAAHRTIESAECQPIAVVVGFAQHWTNQNLGHVAVILALTVLPYLAWRWRSARLEA